MPYTFNGIGTTYYGRRDVGQDGSYITTEWFVLVYLPIMPIGSFRVLPTKNSKNVIFFDRQEYYVKSVPLNWKQIRNTYLIGWGVLGGIMAAIAASNWNSSPQTTVSSATNSSTTEQFGTENTAVSNPSPSPTSLTDSSPQSKPSYVRPKVADNGSPFPTQSGYIKGYPKSAMAGLSSLKIDNSQNDSDAFIKVIVAGSKKSVKPIRVIFIKGRESFTMKNITAGSYAIKHLSLDSGSRSLSDPFELKEDKTADGGIKYTDGSITLYKVANGNMGSQPIEEEDF